MPCPISIESKGHRCHRPLSHPTLWRFTDDRFIGADLAGFFGALHTWGRTLPYHPHVHYVVPAGAITRADDKWHPSRADFFLPVRAMSKIFKAKFYHAMKKCGLASSICADVTLGYYASILPVHLPFRGAG